MDINKTMLRQEFDSLAKSTLKVVSASSLKLFALEVENLAKKQVRSACEKEYNLVSSQLDGEELSKFLDLSSGYLVTMYSWINTFKFNFPSIPVYSEPDEINANPNSLRELVRRKEVQTFGLGTAISIILFFSGAKAIALVTEALAAAASLYLYNQNSTEKEVVNEKAKIEFEHNVNKYISQVINSALSWVDTVESKSSSLIASL